MEEIVISKRKLSVTAIFLSIALLAVSTLWILWSEKLFPFNLLRLSTQSMQTVTSSPTDPGSEAAIEGARAFYSVDTSKGMQFWLDDLCRASTQLGCTVYQNLIVPRLWPSLEAAKINTTATAQAIGKISDGAASTRGNVPMQTWKLSVTLSAPWPVQKSPETHFDAFALVIQEGGVWKFERFITTEEIQPTPGEKLQ